MIMINVIPSSTVSFEKKKINNEKNVYVLNGYQIRSPTTSTSVSQMRSPTLHIQAVRGHKLKSSLRKTRGQEEP